MRRAPTFQIIIISATEKVRRLKLENKIERFSGAPHSTGDEFFSQPVFRLVVVLLSIWITIGTILLHQQELRIKLGLWDRFSINSVNYSKYSDARDSAQIFQDQLIFTRQMYRTGALFVGPVSLYSRQLIRLNDAVAYKMSFDVMAVSDGTGDAGSAIFAGVLFYDKDKNLITDPQHHMFGVAFNRLVKKIDGTVNLYGIFSPAGTGLNKTPHNAYYFKVAIDLNYADSKAAVILSNVNFSPFVSRASGDNK